MAETTNRNGSGGGSGAIEWTPPRGRGRWRLADGEAMVAALRASGESQAAFAQRHGLHAARVHRWVARMGRKGRPAAVVPVPVVAFAPVRVIAARPEASGLEVAVGSAVVRIARGFDEELLRRVVATLGAASC